MTRVTRSEDGRDIKCSGAIPSLPTSRNFLATRAVYSLHQMLRCNSFSSNMACSPYNVRPSIGASNAHTQFFLLHRPGNATRNLGGSPGASNAHTQFFLLHHYASGAVRVYIARGIKCPHTILSPSPIHTLNRLDRRTGVLPSERLPTSPFQATILPVQLIALCLTNALQDVREALLTIHPPSPLAKSFSQLPCFSYLKY